MAEDKTQLSLNEEQSQIPDAGIQEQIKLDADAPVLGCTTGNVIDISGDLIDKIMSQQTAHEVGIPAETPAKEEVPPLPAPAPEEPPQPKDASRGEKEEIVYLDLSQLHPFQNHPFGVRDDNEMKGLVSSVRAGGVHQPALVRPREGGGNEIMAGHRRQRASELAGYKNMPCIVRNMTDDEAVLAMTDDNLRHWETILPSEKAAALKQQYPRQHLRVRHVAGGGYLPPPNTVRLKSSSMRRCWSAWALKIF